GAVDRLDAGDVIGVQRLLRAGVGGVHDGRLYLRVGHAQGVADLVEGDRLQIVGRAVGLPLLRRVEEDVAGVGAAVGRRGQEGESQRARVLRVAADADVAEVGVALLVAVAADGGAVVADLYQVDVGDGLPDGRGLLELELPDGRGDPLGVEGRVEVAGRAADAGPVGHEAVGDAGAVSPEVTGGGVEQLPVLQPLQTGADGPAPGDPAAIDVVVHGWAPADD